MQQFLNLLAVD